MEMNEKIYPRLQATAPIEYETFRLNKIQDIQKDIETCIIQRSSLNKKYNRALTIVNTADEILSTATLGMGVAGVGLLTTIVAAPVVLALEIAAVSAGGISLISKYISKKLKIKADKHKQIKILGESKLNTIYDHISKAIQDGTISDEEFSLILSEHSKFKSMIEDLRKKSNDKISQQEKESLIEKGREEQRSNFRALLENKNKS